MVKERWTSSGFKGGGSNEKCPTTAGNLAGMKGSGKKRKGFILGRAFVLGPLSFVMDSLDNHILHHTYGLGLGEPYYPHFGEHAGRPFDVRTRPKAFREYKEKKA